MNLHALLLFAFFMHISTISAILSAMNKTREQRERLMKLRINTHEKLDHGEIM